MIHNGVELQGMTHNGVEVQTWTHNGVEIYSASKPWVAYEVVNGVLVAHSPAVAPPAWSGKKIHEYPTMLMWQIEPQNYVTSSISTKNADGSNFIPTNKCKYLDVVVRCDINKQNKCTITGRKGGVDTVIRTITLPKYDNNTKNVVDGVSYIQYVHFLENIEVKGYDSVKIETSCTPAGDGSVGWVGLGLTRFHD